MKKIRMLKDEKAARRFNRNIFLRTTKEKRNRGLIGFCSTEDDFLSVDINRCLCWVTTVEGYIYWRRLFVKFGCK